MESNKLYQVLGGAAACLIGLNCGFGIGYTSPCLANIVSDQVLDPSISSWFASILVIAQIAGSLSGPFFSDRFGRKPILLFVSVLSMIGWLIIALSSSAMPLFFGRVLHGFAEGGGSAVAVFFVSETSEVQYKGAFLNNLGLASGFGIALAYIFGSQFSWQLTTVIPILASFSSICSFLWLRETPVYLIKQSKDAAKESLTWYRGVSNQKTNMKIQEELKEMEINVEGCQGTFLQTLQHIKRPENLQPVLIALAVFIFYPLTGVYNITFFAVDLFRSMGLFSEKMVAISSALIRVVGTTGSSLLIYRFGRRNLLLFSSAVAGISMAIVGALILVKDALSKDYANCINWTIVIMLILFMFTAGLAIVTIPWVLLGEWFTPEIKSIVNGLLLTSQFASIFVAVQLTGFLVENVGVSGLMFVFGVTCTLNTIFIAIFVPETHGKLFIERNKIYKTNLQEDYSSSNTSVDLHFPSGLYHTDDQVTPCAEIKSRNPFVRKRSLSTSFTNVYS